jgi:hypothetical protein
MASRLHPPPLPGWRGARSCAAAVALDRLLTDPRGRRGKRPLISVLVADAASAHCGPLAVAQAAAGRDQDVLAGHGCRVSPRTDPR